MKPGNEIKKITRINCEGLEVALKYVDGFKGTVNLEFLFKTPSKGTLPLEIKRGNLFGKCFIESGALAWPNGYELCPDAIRMWITEQGKSSKKAA